MNFMTIYWIGTGIFLICVMAFFIRKIYISKHSEVTRKAATKVLRMRSGIRGWKVLTDVTLGEGARAVTADQVVIGPFGVIVACDLHQRGNVYGELDAEEWIMTTGEEGNGPKTRIASPYHHAGLFVEQLRHEFAQKKIYSVPVEVLIPKTQKQGCYITGSGQYLLDMKELKAYLEKSRFEKDNGVKVDTIVSLLSR